jgi:ubiquinone/menaquinone biosynthesis C-methylase UbiE
MEKQSTETYWDEVYARVGGQGGSWFQTEATVSMAMIEAAGPPTSILDVGAGASVLAGNLLDAGYTDVTCLDVSDAGLQAARTRLGTRASQVQWLVGDVRQFTPSRRYHIWHDRAVFHFLTDPADRDAYRAALRRAVEPGGHVIIATFAGDGPDQCSGLPVARYTAEALVAEFSGLRVEESRRADHLTPAGAVQPFTWLRLAVPRS